MLYSWKTKLAPFIHISLLLAFRHPTYHFPLQVPFDRQNYITSALSRSAYPKPQLAALNTSSVRVNGLCNGRCEWSLHKIPRLQLSHTVDWIRNRTLLFKQAYTAFPALSGM